MKKKVRFVRALIRDREQSVRREAVATEQRVAQATKLVKRVISTIGYAEALWVAEELAFEFGVYWRDEKLTLSLSDLQLIAYAAALVAHHEMLRMQYGIEGKDDTQAKEEAPQRRNKKHPRRSTGLRS